jgi:hypothetical protein
MRNLLILRFSLRRQRRRDWRRQSGCHSHTLGMRFRLRDQAETQTGGPDWLPCPTPGDSLERRRYAVAFDDRRLRETHENQMTKAQFEQQREGVEAQICWAILHGGDQELLDLLRIESDHLCVMIGPMSRSSAHRASTSPRKSEALSRSKPPRRCRLQSPPPPGDRARQVDSERRSGRKTFDVEIHRG